MEQQPINQQSPEAIAVVVSNLKNSEGKFNLDTSGFQPNTAGHSTSHSNMILRQEPRTVKEYGADIGLPYETRLGMALMLDEYQCALHVAMHQYNKHHWMSEVAKSFVSLHQLLAEHIDKIGERMARLGGVPTAHPVTQHE